MAVQWVLIIMVVQWFKSLLQDDSLTRCPEASEDFAELSIRAGREKSGFLRGMNSATATVGQLDLGLAPMREGWMLNACLAGLHIWPQRAC
jgi:hypothetical protein